MQIAVNHSSEVPIYVQVKNQVRLAIERGQLPAGEQMPTVRDLAVNLGINANTVARIYADLEREGYLTRRRGVGTYVAERNTGGHAGATSTNPVNGPGHAQLAETIRQLRALGYSKRQILEEAAQIVEELEAK